MTVWTRRRALAGGGALLLGALGAGGTAAQAPREIAVTARRFGYTPSEIPLKVGEKVVLVFRAIDFMHGFSVPDLKLRADLLPGLETRVELQPQQVGTLDFLCDNFCGDRHEEMHGHFVVTA